MSLNLYRRLQDSAVLLDCDLGLIQVSGPDRVSWLQGMVTNDVAKLRPGQGCYAGCLNPQGKVVSLMVVLADPDTLWLVMEAENILPSVTALDKLLVMEDAKIRDCSTQLGLLSVAGAGARRQVEQIGIDVSLLDSDYAHVETGGFKCVRSALGYDLVAARSEVDQLEGRLLDAGALKGDASLWDAIRIEMGLPRYGVDVDETTILPELGEKGIDYDKGCYIGQEVVAKIKYIGHVNRHFVGLRLEGSSVPAPNSLVQASGRDVGRITSAIRSPGLDAVVALAFVRAGSAQAGSSVEASTSEGTCRGVVSALPFIAHRF